ncbi:MAG: radical SAM protein [Pseudomonadota bacterium]
MINIRKILRKYPTFYNIVRLLRYFLMASVLRINGSKKKYPKVLQLPITYRCNSKCKMCNIWNVPSTKGISSKEFGKILNDPIFKEIIAAGINGGEPSLIPDLPDYVAELLKLPKIQSFNIISNGFIKDPFLNNIEKIYLNCRKTGVSFHIAISLDGVNDVHNIIRGKKDAFSKTMSTIEEILKNQNKYCDSFDVACTVIRQNIDYLIELDSFAEKKNFPITYRLGIENKRIESDRLKEGFSVLMDSMSKQASKEFMHYKFFASGSLYEKLKYFSIFYWLNSDKPRRLLGCAWKDEGATLDAKGDLFYCAVASDRIGNCLQETGEKLFFGEHNILHRKNIIKYNCPNCIHDYDGKPELKNLIIFLKEIFMNRYSMRIYKLKCRLGLI